MPFSRLTKHYVDDRSDDETKPRIISHDIRLTTELCGANEAQRSLRPNERLVRHMTQLTAAHATAEEVNLKITARDGILALDPFAMKLYQGTAAGKTAVNLKGESPAAEVQVNLDQVQINPLLKDLAGKDFLEGTTQGRIALSGSGEDPARIKRSLNGKGSFTLNDGAIVGADLANMVRNVKAAFGAEMKAGSKPRTDFSELIVPFTIENRVFHTPETL